MNRVKLLSTYFPYGLKGEVVTIQGEVTLTGIHSNSVLVAQDSQERKYHIQLHEFTPYLKPVSKITPEEMKKLRELQKAAGLDYSGCSTMYDENTKLNYNQWALEPYYIVSQLLAWHYDIFGELECGTVDYPYPTDTDNFKNFQKLENQGLKDEIKNFLNQK